MKRIILILIITSLIMFGCTKKENTPVAKSQFVEYEGKVLEMSLNEGEVIDATAFMEEMRERNETVYVKQLIMPRNMASFYKVKNITPETEICFGDIDCPMEFRCITACRINGVVKACNIDDFKGMDDIEFKVDYGYCIDWKQTKNGSFVNYG